MAFPNSCPAVPLVDLPHPRLALTTPRPAEPWHPSRNVNSYCKEAARVTFQSNHKNTLWHFSSAGNFLLSNSPGSFECDEMCVLIRRSKTASLITKINIDLIPLCLFSPCTDCVTFPASPLRSWTPFCPPPPPRPEAGAADERETERAWKAVSWQSSWPQGFSPLCFFLLSAYSPVNLNLSLSSSSVSVCGIQTIKGAG